MESLWQLIAAFLLVALNGFFVAAEFAIVKVRTTRIVELAEEGGLVAKIAERAVTHLDAYLSATQLGITLASLGLGWIGEPAFAHLVEPLFHRFGHLSTAAAHATSITVAFIIITFLHIVFGELAPKSLAILKPEGVTLAVAWPLHLFFRIFYPIIWTLNGVANFVLRVFGLRPASEHESAHTTEEIRMILAASARGGSLKDSEAILIERSFNFADIAVETVMIPRVDIDYLSIDWDQSAILETLRSRRHSRYLVVEEEEIDRVMGYVHLEELLFQILDGEADLKSILRPIRIYPESTSIERLLRELQVHHTEIALIMDEYGGTAGLVTVKRLLEELVGDLDDEMEMEPPEIRRTGDGFVIQGLAPLADVSRELNEELESEHYNTLGGWVMGRLERIPAVGDVVESERHRFTVREMDNNRVVEVAARPLPEPPR